MGIHDHNMYVFAGYTSGDPTANQDATCAIGRGARTRNPTSKAKFLQKRRVDVKLIYDPLAKLKKGALTRIMKLVELHTEP